MTDCEECIKKDAVILELSKLLAAQSKLLPKYPYNVAYKFDPSTCACSPSRGGSGVCNCINGSGQIIC